MKIWQKHLANHLSRCVGALLIVLMGASCTATHVPDPDRNQILEADSVPDRDRNCWPYSMDPAPRVPGVQIFIAPIMVPLLVGAVLCEIESLGSEEPKNPEPISAQTVSDGKQLEELKIAHLRYQFGERERRAIEKKASAGDADAQFVLYFNGTATEAEQNYWLCVAAYHRHPRAQLEMGRLFWYGIGSISNDRSIGFMWYSLAAKSGLVRGAIEVAERRPLLTPAEIARSDALIKEWAPKSQECRYENGIASIPQPGASAGEQAYWEVIRGSTDPGDFAAYLATFSHGFYRDEAARRIFKLEQSAELRNGDKDRLKDDPSEEEAALWNSIKDSTDPNEYQAYLLAYPDGHFASIARLRSGATDAARTSKDVSHGTWVGSASISGLLNSVTRHGRGECARAYRVSFIVEHENIRGSIQAAEAGWSKSLNISFKGQLTRDGRISVKGKEVTLDGVLDLNKGIGDGTWKLSDGGCSGEFEVQRPKAVASIDRYAEELADQSRSSSPDISD